MVKDCPLNGYTQLRGMLYKIYALLKTNIAQIQIFSQPTTILTYRGNFESNTSSLTISKPNNESAIACVNDRVSYINETNCCGSKRYTT